MAERASLPKVILGWFAFVVWWVLGCLSSRAVSADWANRGTVLGATLMVVFQVISPNHAFAAVDLPILGLLFGTMVISVYLKRARLFEYLGRTLSWKTRGGKGLLCRLCLLSARSSALFTNDTTCVVLTGFVLELCRELCRSKNLIPKSFLVVLASSSNIGSAATPIGNPQDLVIADNSKISFGLFLSGVLPCGSNRVGGEYFVIVDSLWAFALTGARRFKHISVTEPANRVAGGTHQVELEMNEDK